MISVLIECRDQDHALAATLGALVPAAVEGLVADVIVLDLGAGAGTAMLSEAAGCRCVRDTDLNKVLRSARGDWLLLLEPGARPLAGWIEEVGQHITVARQAARMRPSRRYRRSLLDRWLRWARRRGGLSAIEHGVVMPRSQAIANSRPGRTLESLARGVAMIRLDCEIIPAAVFQPPA